MALDGKRSPRTPFGARVTVVAGDLVQHQVLQSAHGYNSTNDPVMIFGVGSRATVDRVEVRWPSGAVQVIEKPALRQTLRIVEAGP